MNDMQWRLLTAAGLYACPVGLPAPPFSQCRNSHYPPRPQRATLAGMNETRQCGQ